MNSLKIVSEPKIAEAFEIQYSLPLTLNINASFKSTLFEMQNLKIFWNLSLGIWSSTIKMKKQFAFSYQKCHEIKINIEIFNFPILFLI